MPREGAAVPTQAGGRDDELALPSGRAEPERPEPDAGERHDPEPRRGGLAVEPTDVAEEQAAVHRADPRPERQGAGGAVHGQVAPDGRVARVDEHGAGLRLEQSRLGEHHAGGVAGRRRGTDLSTTVSSGWWEATTLPLRGGDLVGEGACRGGGRRGELVPVHDLLDRRGDGVDRPDARGDQDERAHEQARQEVQAEEELGEPATGGARSGAGPIGARVLSGGASGTVPDDPGTLQHVERRRGRT